MPNRYVVVMDRPLLPLPSWPKRLVLCGILILPALLASAPWLVKLFSMLFMVALTGTVRASRVRGAAFESQLFIGFVPLKPARVKLNVIVQIDTGTQSGATAVDFVLFGGVHWVLDRLMQWVWPWLSGEFEIWLVTAREKRILAWRGNGENSFLANLDTLTSATGATVRRM